MDLMEKCNLLENDNDKNIEDESLNDNQDANETKPNVVDNMIENMPQSLLNGTMSNQMTSDESSRRSEWSPESYDSDCNSEQHSLNMEQKFLTEMHAYDEDD